MQKQITKSDVLILKPNDHQSLSLPFAQDLISAGFPSSAENFIENSLDLNELVIKHPTATFFVKVIGDSMIDAGINTNDILVVDRSLSISNNKIIIARINDEFTVKRINLVGDKIFLVADNKKYKPIAIKEETDFEVWGVVTFVIHSLST